MPRKGIKYGQWSEADMKTAIQKYKTGKYGLNKLCKLYNIPKPTFKRHLLGSNRKAKDGTKSLGRLTVFSAEIEKQLEVQILKMEECFYGLTITDIRRAAFDFAEKNGIPNNFNKVKKTAGKAWFYSFMRRHPNLSLRQPESTSLARCKGFNRQNVTHFFDILQNLVDQYHIDATRIYNVDETGFSTVQKKSQKIISKKGKKQVGTVASGERGVNTTLVVCTSASGHYVAPMLIFKRKRMMAELAEGAPPGCLVEVSDTGYINSELFVIWLQRFIEAVKPSKEKKIILVLDGHTTHSKNLEAINLARDNGVILLQLPGHTTHRLQSLDVAIFKPLEVYYNQAVEKWMREHPGLAVTQYQVAKLLGEPYGKAATTGFAINGFSKCGIWPVNRDVFSDVDFAGSDALLEENLVPTQPPELSDHSEQTQNDSSDEDIPLSKLILKRPQTPPLNTPFKAIVSGPSQSVNSLSCSKNAQQVPVLITRPCAERRPQTPPLNTSFEEIISLPGPSQSLNKRPRSKNAQQAAVLTTTPYKDELEHKKEIVNSKAKAVVKRKISSGESKNLKCKKTQIAPPSVEVTEAIIETNPSEWHCQLCNECIIEDMIQCTICLNWVHESCAGTLTRQLYVCDFCT